MSISKFASRKNEAKKKRAVALYKSGMSFRDVSKVVGMSHEWVRSAYLSTVSFDKVRQGV